MIVVINKLSENSFTSFFITSAVKYLLFSAKVLSDTELIQIMLGGGGDIVFGSVCGSVCVFVCVIPHERDNF